MFFLSLDTPQPRQTPIVTDAARRLTAARLGRYGWRNHRRFALAANDRGTRLQETEGRGVS